LKELWETKDRLAREAGYDPQRFLEILRQWEAEHPHPGPVARGPEALRQLVAAEENERAASSAWMLRDAPVDEE